MSTLPIDLYMLCADARTAARRAADVASIRRRIADALMTHDVEDETAVATAPLLCSLFEARADAAATCCDAISADYDPASELVRVNRAVWTGAREAMLRVASELGPKFTA